ncbi:MAG: hypothetical protein RJA36_912 [Pseudomonadota bacterium]|jgi:hypothetical protein
MVGADVATAAQLAAAVALKLTGDVVQTVNSQTGAVATGTTTMVNTDTIPTNTQGDQYLSAAITPASATNKLRIEVVLFLANSAAANSIVAGIFQDSTANALCTGYAWAQNAGGIVCLTMSYYMTAGTTSLTTFKVRAGGSSAGTTTLNGTGGARVHGGVLTSSITITEFKA